MAKLEDLTREAGTVCACTRCACVNDAELVLGTVAMCGCCAADCPDVHEGAWERREALYARATLGTSADHSRTVEMLGACAETPEERAMIRRAKQAEAATPPPEDDRPAMPGAE